MSAAVDRDISEEWALAADAADPLGGFRSEFCIPRENGREIAYFCGNSLGLQPRATRQAVIDELDYWAELAVEGHFRGRLPWMDYHEFVRDDLAMMVGAKPIEVVAMNSLSVNLHLLMVSFYRPSAGRAAILIEKSAFPSDRYAVEAQVRFHGHDPDEALIELEPDQADGTLSDASILAAIEQHGSRLALVLLPGVQYLTGQALDLHAISKAAHAKGCMVGFDLAHAVGNMDLQLHDAGCDFAVWCSYKYLNSGPGAVGGAFVHERHATTTRPRFAGWWGHEKSTRFKMGPQFRPTPGADGWQLSNPPILALAPLRISLQVFQRAGFAALRGKSRALTGYLEWLIAQRVSDVLAVVTPKQASRRGCQLSLRVKGPRESGRKLFEHLQGDGIVVDWREPDIIRAAPVPLYNRFIDCRRLIESVARWRATQQ
ncbi:MAG: kynureninase [Dokdonella sp.]